MRTVLLHVNVEVSDDDPRNAGEIAEAVQASIEVGGDNPFSDAPSLQPVIVLAEEV